MLHEQRSLVRDDVLEEGPEGQKEVGEVKNPLNWQGFALRVGILAMVVCVCVLLCDHQAELESQELPRGGE